MRRLLSTLGLWLALITTLSLSGCGYNTLQAGDEQIKAQWAEVLNQYQRRADLVPNLVRTVQGAANFERQTLEAVVNARARATSINATPELVNDPAAFAQFEAAQRQLSGSLGRLMVVAEQYPDLKATAAFRDLQAQLEGTENRITVARKRYIDAVQAYNITVRSFPSNLTAMAFGHHVKPSFTVSDEAAISTPPAVDFGGAPAAPAASRP